MEKGESLEDYLNRLIAEKDGIKPEEVTVEYIRQQREKRFNDLRYDCPEGLICFTGNEWNKIEKIADKQMELI